MRGGAVKGSQGTGNSCEAVRPSERKRVESIYTRDGSEDWLDYAGLAEKRWYDGASWVTHMCDRKDPT